MVELRSADGATPAARTGRRGDQLGPIDGRGARLELVAPYATASACWLAGCAPTTTQTVPELLWRLGEPIRYGYVAQRWPLERLPERVRDHAGQRRDAERRSPVHAELITALVARGIAVAPICLHTGVSSPERHEPPFPERYRRPRATPRARSLPPAAAGGRVIAVGTTVVGALETVVDGGGAVRAGQRLDEARDRARPEPSAPSTG